MAKEKLPVVTLSVHVTGCKATGLLVQSVISIDGNEAFYMPYPALKEIAIQHGREFLSDISCVVNDAISGRVRRMCVPFMN